MFKYLSVASVLVTLGLCGCSSDGGDSPSGGDNGGSGGGANADVDQSSGKTCGANRNKMTCAELKTKLEEDSKSVGFELKVTLGPWTDVPDALKVLPAGAELCGSVDAVNQGLVVSDLDCDALHDYYQKVFEDDLGCKEFKCETQTSGSQGQMHCTCGGSGQPLGQLVTSPETQYYLLAITG